MDAGIGDFLANGTTHPNPLPLKGGEEVAAEQAESPSPPFFRGERDLG
jgi:hypothetical protein